VCIVPPIADSGDSWQFFDSGLPIWGNTYTLSIAPNGNILAGLSDGGVFISFDNGEHWSDYSSGLTSQFVRALTVNDLGFGFAGAGTQGVFRTINLITGINGAETPTTGEFLLYQNYPNPFNPVTNIGFRIPQGGRSNIGVVELVVLDLLGREVKTLMSGKVPAGYYTVRWDGTDDNGQPVASGVYVYRLQVGNNFHTTKKLVLLR